MAQFTLTTPTTVAIGAGIPFENTVVSECCRIRHRAGSANIQLSGGTFCYPRKYRIIFHGNISGATGAENFTIYLDGEPLPETLMSVNAGAVANIYSIDASTIVCVDCQCGAISVRNTGATDLTVNTASIIIEGVS